MTVMITGRAATMATSRHVTSRLRGIRDIRLTLIIRTVDDAAIRTDVPPKGVVIRSAGRVRPAQP